MMIGWRFGRLAVSRTAYPITAAAGAPRATAARRVSDIRFSFRGAACSGSLTVNGQRAKLPGDLDSIGGHRHPVRVRRGTARSPAPTKSGQALTFRA
jgi:hypothetical protein